MTDTTVLMKCLMRSLTKKVSSSRWVRKFAINCLKGTMGLYLLMGRQGQVKLTLYLVKIKLHMEMD